MRVRAEHAWLAAAFAGGLLLPTILGEANLPIYVLLNLAAIVTVGVSLLMGHAGQVSLGQGAFYACGAYTAGVLSVHGAPTWLALCCAPLFAAGVAALLGIPLLRLRGHHLAFATLAMHLIFLSLVSELELVGGDVGLQGIPRLQLAGVALDSNLSYAYLSYLALAAVVVVARNVLSSRPGRALRALSSSEVAAASAGIRVAHYKLAVFALSAAFAGIAGGIYAFQMRYLAPGSFPVMMSIEYVVMAALGGLGRISGALVGSALVYLLVHGLSRLATHSGMPSSAPVVLSYAVYAALLIAAVLFLPSGMVGALSQLVNKRRAAASRPERAVTSARSELTDSTRAHSAPPQPNHQRGLS